MKEQGTGQGLLWNVLAQSTMVPCGLITVAVLTRVLGREDYGRYALVITVISWVQSAVLQMFVRSAATGLAVEAQREAVGSALLRVTLGSGLAAGVALFVLATPVTRLCLVPGSEWLLAVAAIDVPLFVVAQAHANALSAVGLFRERAGATALRWTARTALVVLVAFTGAGITGAVLASAGASLAELCLCRTIWPLRLRTVGHYPVSLLFNRALAHLVAILSVRVLDSLDLFMLEKLGSVPGETGAYAAALNLSLLPGILGMGVWPVLLARLCARFEDGRSREARGLVRYAAGIGLAGLLLVPAASAWGRPLTALAFGPGYQLSGDLLAQLLGAGVARFLFLVPLAALIALGRARWTAALTLGTLTLAPFAYARMIPAAGAHGAAQVSCLLGWTTTVAAFGLLLLAWPRAGTPRP